MLSKYFHACFSDFYHACYYCILPISAAISIACYKKAAIAFKWICVLIILTCISEFTALFMGLRYGSNGIIYNVFTPIEYFIYVNIYRIFLASKKWREILFVSAGCLLFLDILNVMFFQPVREPPTNILNVEMVMLAFLSLLLFIKIRERPVYQNILGEGIFWFNSAVLFYYTFSILTWGFYGIMYNMKDPPKINGHMLLLSSGLLYLAFVFSIFLNSYSVKTAKDV